MANNICTPRHTSDSRLGGLEAYTRVYNGSGAISFANAPSIDCRGKRTIVFVITESVAGAVGTRLTGDIYIRFCNASATSPITDIEKIHTCTATVPTGAAVGGLVNKYCFDIGLEGGQVAKVQVPVALVNGTAAVFYYFN